LKERAIEAGDGGGGVAALTNQWVQIFASWAFAGALYGFRWQRLPPRVAGPKSCKKMITHVHLRLMPSADEHEETPRGGTTRFPTTHWSVVIAAAAADKSRDAKIALETLCRTYWYPVYAFFRRDGKDHHTAEDLTQGCIAYLLELKSLENVSRAKGKFRAFLLATARNFMLGQKKEASADKRGSGRALLSLDHATAERRYALETVANKPEELYDLAWAQTIWKSAGDRLWEEYHASSKSTLLEQLLPVATALTNDLRYEELASRLQVPIPVNTLKSHVRRIRRRFCELIREEVASVSNPEEVDEEFAYLGEILGRPEWRS
jgi:DNA-directed RNA polymerase specialized sigma24 family protein